MTTEQWRAVVTHVVAEHATSERRACRLVSLSRSRWQYAPCRPDRAELRGRLRGPSDRAPGSGYQRLYVLLRREGYVSITSSCSGSIARRGSLSVVGRRSAWPWLACRARRRSWPMSAGARTSWRMRWRMGRAIRCLTIVDDCTRECPAIEVAQSLPAMRAITVLERLALTRGLPHSIVCDNGPESAGRALDQWAHARGIALQFIRPGKPVKNCFIESFNGRLRDECLNSACFSTLADAQHIIEAWRHDYNTTRPHGGLAGRTPIEYSQELQSRTTTFTQRLTA